METLSATAFADKIIMARQRARAEHERIFGKKSFRQLGMMDISSNRFVGKGTGKLVKKAKSKARRKKKEICPHCATKNFVKVNTFTNKCNKCGYER